jgi:hypothetical protein
VLARNIIFFCGCFKKEGNALLEFAELMYHAGFPNPESSGLDASPDPGRTGIRDLRAIRIARAERLDSGTSTFVKDVFDTRRRKVAKPLDRVYALLGLAEGRYTVYRMEIPIDYFA